VFDYKQVQWFSFLFNYPRFDKVPNEYYYDDLVQSINVINLIGWALIILFIDLVNMSMVNTKAGQVNNFF